jgi:hypothetical protein
VITAPPYWQDKAAAKAHSAAANASVRTSDAFFENVMVRVEDSKAAKAAAVEPAPKPRHRPSPSPSRNRSRSPNPSRAQRHPCASQSKKRPLRRRSPRRSRRRRHLRRSRSNPNLPSPRLRQPPRPLLWLHHRLRSLPRAAPKPSADPSAAIKKRFEQNLNGGQPAEGTLEVAQLQKDDVIYESGSVRAVVRRFGPRNQLFWLNGELNTERAELVPTGTDRYRVNEPIRNVANPSLRGGAKTTALKFVGNVPAPKSPARTSLEKAVQRWARISAEPCRRPIFIRAI